MIHSRLALNSQHHQLTIQCDWNGLVCLFAEQDAGKYRQHMSVAGRVFEGLIFPYLVACCVEFPSAVGIEPARTLAAGVGNALRLAVLFSFRTGNKEHSALLRTSNVTPLLLGRGSDGSKCQGSFFVRNGEEKTRHVALLALLMLFNANVDAMNGGDSDRGAEAEDDLAVGQAAAAAVISAAQDAASGLTDDELERVLEHMESVARLPISRDVGTFAALQEIFAPRGGGEEEEEEEEEEDEAEQEDEKEQAKVAAQPLAEESKNEQEEQKVTETPETKQAEEPKPKKKVAKVVAFGRAVDADKATGGKKAAAASAIPSDAAASTSSSSSSSSSSKPKEKVKKTVFRLLGDLPSLDGKAELQLPEAKSRSADTKLKQNSDSEKRKSRRKKKKKKKRKSRSRRSSLPSRFCCCINGERGGVGGEEGGGEMRGEERRGEPQGRG